MANGGQEMFVYLSTVGRQGGSQCRLQVRWLIMSISNGKVQCSRMGNAVGRTWKWQVCPPTCLWIWRHRRQGPSQNVCTLARLLRDCFHCSLQLISTWATKHSAFDHFHHLTANYNQVLPWKLKNLVLPLKLTKTWMKVRTTLPIISPTRTWCKLTILLFVANSVV